MRKNEEEAVVNMMRHMQALQRQITKPSCAEATDEEVLKLLEMLWEWRPVPRYKLPGKHTIEQLVGFMRGCQRGGYCYISRGDVARIIREEARRPYAERNMAIDLNAGASNMTDNELYDNGRWNYRPTPLVDLLFQLHCNS